MANLVHSGNQTGGKSTKNAQDLADILGGVADLTALTDSTTGTAADTLAAGVGVETIWLPMITLAEVADGDLITDLTLGYKFKILSVAFVVDTAVTTAAKATTLTVEIGAVATTGGALALTSANCTPKGAVVAGTAITALNTGSAAATISLVAASTTTFVEGKGSVVLTVQNMDTADAVASLADRINDTISQLGGN
jgi:hypothetical protein